MHVLNTNFNVEGVFKCFIAYGAFTAANFPYKGNVQILLHADWILKP